MLLPLGLSLWLSLCAALRVPVPPPEEDFGFEPDSLRWRGDHGLGPAGRAGAPTSAPAPVRRVWGIPDTSATAGKLFRFTIPSEAFEGDVDHFEAQGQNGAPLPSWLLFDQTTGLFEGVPSLKDVGEIYVLVRAVSRQSFAIDKFSIEVHPRLSAPSAGRIPFGLTTHHHPKVKCEPEEDATILSVLVDMSYDHLKPRQRLTAIDNLSGFLSLSHDLFQLVPQTPRDDILLEDTVVMAGEGNIKKRKWKQGSVVQWQVGCDGNVWAQQAALVQDLKQQARDGTLAEVLRLPVIGWHIKTDSTFNTLRGRREANGLHEAGSGNYAEDGSADDNESEVPDSRVVPTMASPVPNVGTATPVPDPHTIGQSTLPDQHHHRHHHGDVDAGAGIQEVDNPVEDFRNTRPDSGPLAPYLSSSFGGGGFHVPSSPAPYGNIMPTPTLDVVKPTLMFNEIGSTTPEVSRSFDERVEVTPSPVLPTEPEPTTYPTSSSVGGSSFGPYLVSNTDHLSHVTDSTTDMNAGAGSATSESILETSTEKPVTFIESSDYDSVSSTSMGQHSTSGSTTPSLPSIIPTTSTTTESVEISQKNFPPVIQTRLSRLPVTAGKILKYVVPDDTFNDLEDGNTRNLRLSLKTSEGEELSLTSWIQFNAARREVTLLPLEEHVSKWYFSLEATDKDGASVADNLEIIVQHHQARRAFNHEFIILMDPTSLLRKQRVLQWEVVLVEALARVFNDPDTSQITIRNLNISQLLTNESISISYSNDSLSRNHCPHDRIQEMLKLLRQNENGDPSKALLRALGVHANHLNIRKVLYKGSANCEVQSKPEAHPEPPGLPDAGENYPPVPRNQVDHISATVGMLLIYKVLEDSFYDPEDGPASKMKLSLLTLDHSPIPPENWLQFDTKNQEFYGIPMPDDEGNRGYQLVCEDSGGLRAYDGLEVTVDPSPRIQYSVEFSMTLKTPYESFVDNALLKRKFVEKLRILFGDPDASAIVLGRINKGSTVVTWYNRTLPTSYCPNELIKSLRSVLVNEDDQISPRLTSVLGPEFTILSVGLYPTVICQGELTPLHPTEPPPLPVDELTPIGTSEEYLITFVVPAVIICTMLLLAGVVACVLYRRRRTGKMSVGDEDERQSFRNKGIPVIFQDELEDQTEPMNKSPVIMKEEKPPLPPPEYQRHNPSPPPTQALLSDAEDAEPYQPPPPFTTSRDTARHTRHKSTPTYRKPPPYVPP